MQLRSCHSALEQRLSKPEQGKKAHGADDDNGELFSDES
jgi:hypothetical protein